MSSNNYIKIIGVDKNDLTDRPRRRLQTFLYFFVTGNEASFITAQNAATYKAEKLKEEKYRHQLSVWHHVEDCPYPEIGEVVE